MDNKLKHKKDPKSLTVDDSPGMTMTLKGMRRSLVAVSSLCVPMITLYEYFTAWPRNDGGASVGIASTNLTARTKEVIINPSTLPYSFLISPREQ